MVTASGGIMQKPGDGTHFTFWSGEEFIWKLTGADTDGVLDIGEMVVDPGVGVPEHIHHGNDETFYVLNGRFCLTVAGQQYDLQPSGFVFVPRGVRHVWVNNGSAPARILLTFTPGGMDQYFVELNPLLQAPMDMERIGAVARSTGTS